MEHVVGHEVGQGAVLQVVPQVFDRVEFRSVRWQPFQRQAREILQHGADGFIPSAGNLNPALCSRMCSLAQKGDWALLTELQREVDALQAEFAGETIGRSIARLKRLMNRRGLCGSRVFLPLQEEP